MVSGGLFLYLYSSHAGLYHGTQEARGWGGRSGGSSVCDRIAAQAWTSGIQGQLGEGSNSAANTAQAGAVSILTPWGGRLGSWATTQRRHQAGVPRGRRGSLFLAGRGPACSLQSPGVPLALPAG